MLIFNSIEFIKVVKIQTLANEQMFNDAFVILTIAFMTVKKHWLFNKWSNVLTKKKSYRRLKIYTNLA